MMDTNRFNDEHAAKSRAVCELIEREDAERRGKLADLMDVQLKSELGRAKGSATGWEKKAERRLKHIGECEKALAKRNERISKLEKQVGYLRAELANAKVLSERERQILYMWPRFEDGEYVWFGDEYKCWCGESHACDGVNLISNGGAIIETFERSHDVTHKSGFASGEFVKRPAAKVLDADGVEIKVGDTVWWQHEPTEYTVKDVSEGSVYLSYLGSIGTEHVTTTFTHHLTHTRPDSWERLEEDAAKEPCDYFGVEYDDDKGCSGCPRLHKGRDCTIDMRVDLIRRAKALAGVEVSE